MGAHFGLPEKPQGDRLHRVFIFAAIRAVFFWGFEKPFIWVMMKAHGFAPIL
jgi:hypothetical protein